LQQTWGPGNSNGFLQLKLGCEQKQRFLEKQRYIEKAKVCCNSKGFIFVLNFILFLVLNLNLNKNKNTNSGQQATVNRQRSGAGLLSA
jgi:hypothetical protein